MKPSVSVCCSFVILALLSIPGVSPADEIRVGTWKTPQTIQPFFYAQFMPADTDLRVFAFTNPADQKTALLAGSLDMCGTTLAHAIHSAAIGQPVVVVAALCNKCSALVVQKDGPIQGVADLKGKKIGYVPGTMHEILLRETLTRHGLSPETDVQLTRVDFFDMGLALASGGIDAFLSGEPFPALALRAGLSAASSPTPYSTMSVGTINAAMLVTRKTRHAKSPERVSELVKAHALATRYLVRHPDRWLEKASGFGTERAVLDAAAPNIELAWEMDPAFVARARALGARMQALKLIDRQPDYDTLFDLSFVQRVQQETAR
ncbi:MAG: ABC transporter substrate-binding protein [Desulfobacterales bacterium]|nr:ABC transporter substrate-binding protein [Desulfobacterales bacterium]